MKRAVITGPTGAIGTALIAELISHGIEVEAVVRPDSRRTDNIPKSPLVHIVPCDLKELKTLHEKIEHALDAVEAAAALGCTTFVGAGSQAEYGRVEGSLNASTPAFPENGYGIAKLCTGQMTKILCEQKGIRHIWTRILSICIFSERKACPVRLTVSAVERQDRFGNTSKQSVMRQHRGQRLDLEKFLIRKSR